MTLYFLTRDHIQDIVFKNTINDHWFVWSSFCLLSSFYTTVVFICEIYSILIINNDPD